MKKIIVPALLAIALSVSCKNGDKNGFEVKLAYKNADQWTARTNAGKADSRVYLEEIVYGKSQLPVIVDSQKLSGSSGTLVFHGKTKEQGIFELVIGENALAVPLINDAPEMQIWQRPEIFIA